MTFADLPLRTGVPQEFPAGTLTVVRRTSYPSRANLACTRSAASAKFSDVASRGPMSPASVRTSRSAASASIVGSRGSLGVDVADRRGRGLTVLIVDAAVAAGELEAMGKLSGTTGGESTLHPAARANKTSPTAARSISSTIRPLEESYARAC